MINWVELIDDEQAFDQSCKYGNRVDSHAVYCHSEDQNAPRKCRRTWYTGGQVKDEDCPFYSPNPNLKTGDLA